MARTTVRKMGPTHYILMVLGFDDNITIGTNIVSSCICLSPRVEANGLASKHLKEGIKRAIEEVQDMPREAPSHGEEKPKILHGGPAGRSAGRNFSSAGRSGDHTPDGPAYARPATMRCPTTAKPDARYTPSGPTLSVGRSGVHTGRQLQRGRRRGRLAWLYTPDGPTLTAGPSDAHAGQ